MASPLRAEPAPKRPVGANDIFAALTRPDQPAELDALHALRDALSGPPDPQRLAAARSQLEQVLQAEERHQADMPPALVMSGIASRIESAMAGLEAARRVPPPAPPVPALPPFLVPGLAAVSAALGVALIACLAGLAARGRQSEEAEELRETLKKIRRRLEGPAPASGAGGGLAQELAEVASGEASEAVHQAAVAVDRLGAAARDAENRLESSVGAAEARLHAAATMAGQLEQWVEALPERLAETVQAMEARGLAAVEEAALRLENGAAPLDEIGLVLADYGGAVTGLTAQAEQAAQDLQAVVAKLDTRLETAAGTLPERIEAALRPVLGELSGGADLLAELSNLSIGQAAKLEDIIARADKVAVDLPAIGQVLEAASAHLSQQIAQDAGSAACVNEAAEALEARLLLAGEGVQTRLEAGAGQAGDLLTDRLAGLADSVEARLKQGADAVQAQLQASAETVSEGLAARLSDAAERTAARLAGRAELFQAGLEAGAGAVAEAASALPAIKDGLREVAVHLAREASAHLGTLTQVAKSLAAESAALLQATRSSTEAGAATGTQDTARTLDLHALAERIDDLLARVATIVTDAETARSEREADRSERVQEADQMASLLDALAGRAEACLGALPAEAAALAATAAQLRGDAAELGAAAARIAADAGAQGAAPADIAAALGPLETLRQRLEENLGLLGETRAALAHEVSAIGHETRQMQHGSAAAQAAFAASLRESETAIRDAVHALGRTIAELPDHVPASLLPPDPGVPELRSLIGMLAERQAAWLERLEQLGARAGAADGERDTGAAERQAAAGMAVQSEKLVALLERAEALAARAPDGAPVFVAADPMAQEIAGRLAAQAERIAGLLDRNEHLAKRLAQAAEAVGHAPALPAVPAHVPPAVDSRVLEAATETVQRAVERLLESAAAQEAALTRASKAAAEVAALAAAPEGRGTDRMGLAGLNGLASLAENLQGEAESLAASVLRGETVRFPAELVSQTPVMLAAIETSIHRLRGTATALALASDAQRKAA